MMKIPILLPIFCLWFSAVAKPHTPATVVLPGDKDLAMFVAFSCRAFLDRLKK